MDQFLTMLKSVWTSDLGPLVLGQLAVLLFILLLLVKLLWMCRLSPVQRTLFKLGFEVEARPNDRSRRDAWASIGAWRNLPGSFGAIRWRARGTLTRRTVHVFEHGAPLQNGDNSYPGFVVFATDVGVRYRGMRFVPVRFEREAQEPMMDRVPEASGMAFEQVLTTQMDRGDLEVLALTRTMQGLLLTLPRCCQVAMGEGSVCIGVDARVARRECAQILAKLVYLGDLVEATAPKATVLQAKRADFQPPESEGDWMLRKHVA